jgi:hypothetical protein
MDGMDGMDGIGMMQEKNFGELKTI